MSLPIALTKKDIESLLDKLNASLALKSIKAEINLLGGAVMCLALDARASTVDTDDYFLPTKIVRGIVKEIAAKEGISESWLNDGVKGFFSKKGDFTRYLEKSHLTIYIATPEYLLAMKCLSMRIGEEFSDVQDVAFLLRYLNIDNTQDAITVISQYYDFEKFPAKTSYVLQDLLTL